MTRAQFMKYDAFGMGFDLGLYEQVIWNTAHGRPFATSNFRFTDVHLGADVILLEAILAAPYRLLPRTETLLFLETLAVGLGALPLFALARDRLGPGPGLAISFAYLAYVPLHFLNLYEFQPRAFALVLVFAMFHFLSRERLGPFLLCALLALTTRSDVALTLAMLGLYALLQRKPRAFGLSALALGLGWFAVAVFVVVPFFNRAERFQYLAWYGHLGSTPGEMLLTLLTRPLFVLRSLAAPAKVAFLAQVWGPLAFLPALRPDVLLLAAPTLALTLLSERSMVSDIRYQYASLLYPLAFIATVLAIASLARRAAARYGLRETAMVSGLAGAVVVGCVAAHFWIGSPAWRWLRREGPPHYAPAARRVMAMIPEGASLACSSRLGAFLGRREGLFLFPPGNEFYSDQVLERAEYIMVDKKFNKGDPTLEGLKSEPWWQVVAKEDRFVLFRRVARFKSKQAGGAGLPDPAIRRAVKGSEPPR